MPETNSLKTYVNFSKGIYLANPIFGIILFGEIRICDGLILGPLDKMFKILKVLSDKQEMNSQVLGCRDGHILYIKNNFTL